MSTLRLAAGLPAEFTNRISRSFIGFDSLLNAIDQVSGIQEGYPPYNVLKSDETHYEIELAVAGLTPSEINIVQEKNKLTISSDGKVKSVDDTRAYIHQGIAHRKFSRVFNLQEHVNVTDAVFENGMLTIKLERIVPEELKPRTIEIVAK